MGEHIILGIETSCDETAVAIVRLTTASGGTSDKVAAGQVLANQLYSQIKLHTPYGGVVPELAARAHIERLDGLARAALAEAEIGFGAIDAIAATAGPGLIGGLLVGLSFGKALALAHDKMFYGINHLEGHALTVRLVQATEFPYLLLLVSGGHCQLLAVRGLGDYDLLGTTRDDAVGEAFDKAAKLLGLGYPGGPEIEKLAAQGDPHAFALPRPLINDKQSGCDFSFSGLKTALRQVGLAHQPINPTQLADLAAGFQMAVLDCLADRTAHAMAMFRQIYKLSGPARFVVAGGVAANQALRQRLDHLAAQNNFALQIAPPALCTDNAAMIAWAAAERHLVGANYATGFEVAAQARWPLSDMRL